MAFITHRGCLVSLTPGFWRCRLTAILAAGWLISCGGEVADEDPLERFVAAVCACGDGFKGCPDNVRGEAQYANRACLTEYAEMYEHSCSGRPQPTCTF